MNDIDTELLATFRVVVDEGSFDSAAVALRVTPSAISQRIKALEVAVGRVLLQRSRPVRPTASGTELLLLARQIALLTSDFRRRLEGAEPGSLQLQSIPIAANAESLGTWLMPALARAKDFATFDIHREDEEHSTAHLREGSVMAAVTSASKAVLGCTVTRLGKMRYRPMATRDFIERWFPEGPTAAALSIAPVVAFDRKDDIQNRYLRRHGGVKVDPPTHFVPSIADYATAVLSGMGWGCVSELQFRGLHSRKRLIEFDPGSFVETPLYWQQWKLSSAALDRVAELVLDEAAATLA